MSLRNIRKIYGENVLPPPEGNSDEEFEPLYAKKETVSKSIFQGLELSSHSESEPELDDAIENEITEPKVSVKRKKKKKGKRAKQIQRKSSKENVSEVDEVEQSVKEVNAILGVPSSAKESGNGTVCTNQIYDLMAVQQKHLNVANELKRMFGPEAVNQGNRRRGRQSNLNILLKKSVIVPVGDFADRFQKIGLSMSVSSRENGCTYFTYDHDKEYQKLHRLFTSRMTQEQGIMALEGEKLLQVEALLEAANFLHKFEHYSTANSVIEQAIAYMQYVAHPAFNLTDKTIRLEYRVMENRPFHVAILKYLHLLTNRACHRTALELAKLLLNLDPSDPLAVLLIIDTLALRAREHQWLIEAVDLWSKERQAGFLFNMQYSYAMAHFHVATKNKDDLSKADALLQDAMLRFPTVVMKLFECASLPPSAKIQNHPLFNSLSESSTSKNLQEIISLYCKFIWPKWRENGVFEWLTRNCNEMADKYDNDKQIQERAKALANERLNLFQYRPEQVLRHLAVISPMSNLLVEGAVPQVADYAVSVGTAANPIPPANGIDRYNYQTSSNASRRRNPETRGWALYELFRSVLPTYDPDAAPLEMEYEQMVNQREMVLHAEAGGQPDALDSSEESDFDEHEDRENGRPDLVSSVGELTAAVRNLMMEIFDNSETPEANGGNAPNLDNQDNDINDDREN